MRGVLWVCASAGTVNAAATAMVISFASFIPFSCSWTSASNNASARRRHTPMCKRLLQEVGRDELQRIGDEAINAPIREPPGGLGLVHRPAEQRVTRGAYFVRLALRKPLVVAMHGD